MAQTMSVFPMGAGLPGRPEPFIPGGPGGPTPTKPVVSVCGDGPDSNGDVSLLARVVRVDVAQTLTSAQMAQALSNIGGQSVLVSGTSIKTLFGQSLLGSGAITTPTTLSGYGITDAAGIAHLSDPSAHASLFAAKQDALPAYLTGKYLRVGSDGTLEWAEAGAPSSYVESYRISGSTLYLTQHGSTEQSFSGGPSTYLKSIDTSTAGTVKIKDQDDAETSITAADVGAAPSSHVSDSTAHSALFSARVSASALSGRVFNVVSSASMASAVDELIEALGGSVMHVDPESSASTVADLVSATSVSPDTGTFADVASAVGKTIGDGDTVGDFVKSI